MTREEAIKILEQSVDYTGLLPSEFWDSDDGINEALNMAIEALNERSKGEWIVTEHCSNEHGFRKWVEIRCPFCGHEPVYENIDDMEFCPKCGADMRGGS